MNKEIFKYDKYRLVTRSDFDGLVCAMILKEMGILEEIKFVHPKDVQDGTIELTDRDITTNLPYDSRTAVVFDHHESEETRNADVDKKNYILESDAPSAARVVYNYFKKEHPEKLKRITEEIMTAVDRADSAQYTKEEILNPKGWVLLNFIMDARTGLGRFKEFTISNYQLMMELIDNCLDHGIEDVLALSDVKERIDFYVKEQEAFKAQLENIVKIDGKVCVIDLREQEIIHAGNRFYIYAMYPEVEISIHVAWGFKKQNTAVMIGKSIVNRKSDFDIGKLCLKYGGGGHKNAGTCQIDNEKADEVIKEIVAEINGA